MKTILPNLPQSPDENSIVLRILTFFMKIVGKILGYVVGSIVITMGVFWLITWNLGSSISSSKNIIPVDSNHKITLTLNLSAPMGEKPVDPLESLIEGPSLVLSELIEEIDHAAQDPQVDSLLLRLEEPMMGIAQAQEVRAAIKRFQGTGKKAIAYSDTYGEANSGLLSYYLASACKEVYVQGGGYVNLKGISIEVPFLKDAFKKYDIQVNFGKREKYKSAPETFTESDFSDANRESTESMLQSLMSTILGDISKERNIPLQTLKEKVDISPLEDKDALSSKLITKIASYDAIPTSQKISFRSYQNQKKASQNLALSEDIPVVALVYGEGEIHRDPNSFEQPLGSERVMGGNKTARALKDAIEDPKVKGIIFRVDSPGGSAIASETIWNATMLARSHKKPLIVSMGNYAASGGYLVSTHATKIVAEPGTITGSIGTFMGKFITAKLWERFGVHWGTIGYGKHSDMWSSNREFTPEEWRRINTLLDNTYESFMKKVSEGRKIPMEKVREIAQGRVWTGEQALKIGLVDALGGISTAKELLLKELKIAKDSQVSFVHYPRDKSFFTKVIEGLFSPHGGDEEEMSVTSKGLKNALGLDPLIKFVNTVNRVLDSANSGSMRMEGPQYLGS